MDDCGRAVAAYFDNAATTFPKPEAVYVAADAFYRAGGANANRGQNPLARQSAKLISRTREKLSRWLGAPEAERVIFSPSATIALNQVILGSELRRGDVVYVTPFEHNSVLRPLEHLRTTTGIEVRELPFDRRTFDLDIERARAMLFSTSPAMVVVSHVSNVCGLLLQVEELARLVRRANPDCVVVVDGAQAAGLYPLALTTGLVDYYVFSGHKALYGPYGLAGFVLASERRPAPVLFGGTGTESESLEMPARLPSTYEPGSQNSWAAAGLEAALDWLTVEGHQSVTRRAQKAAEEVICRLERLQGVRLYLPPAERRTTIVSFAIGGLQPQAIEATLGARGIAVRAGLHCAPLAHRWLGTLESGGTVRASTSHFTTSKDIDLLATAIEELATR